MLHTVFPCAVTTVWNDEQGVVARARLQPAAVRLNKMEYWNTGILDSTVHWGSPYASLVFIVDGWMAPRA
jgi:hypothetical protein